VDGAEDRLRRLFADALAGDAAAYRAFLKDLGAHLRGFLRKRLERLPDDIEDLVQETLLAIHNQRHTYDAGLPLTAWVHAIARYKLVDLLRRRAAHEAMNQPLDDEEEWLATEETESAEAADAQAAAPEAPAETGPVSVLTTIEGVGPKTAEHLIEAGYDTIDKIAAMDDAEILAVPGIGEKTASKILASAKAMAGKK